MLSNPRLVCSIVRILRLDYKEWRPHVCMVIISKKMTEVEHGDIESRSAIDRRASTIKTNNMWVRDKGCMVWNRKYSQEGYSLEKSAVPNAPRLLPDKMRGSRPCSKSALPTPWCMVAHWAIKFDPGFMRANTTNTRNLQVHARQGSWYFLAASKPNMAVSENSHCELATGESYFSIT